MMVNEIFIKVLVELVLIDDVVIIYYIVLIIDGDFSYIVSCSG